MSREEFIKNNAIIQKALQGITAEDMQYFNYIANGGKVDQKDLRLKQLLFHMTSHLNVFEMRKLMKAFKTLSLLDG